MDQWRSQRQELWEVCSEMYRRGLVGAYSGNASLRLEGAGAAGARQWSPLLLVTPTHRPYYRLKPEELVVINLEGEPVEDGPVPSSETALHLEIYRQRADVAAVVHTHSVYASAMAVAGREIPPIIDEMVVSIGGSVQISDYAFPGTEELAQAACRALGDRNAALLRHHGVVGVGLNIWEALEVCDLVERVAKIFILAQSFGPGRAKPLPPVIIDIEQQLFQMQRRASLGL